MYYTIPAYLGYYIYHFYIMYKHVYTPAGREGGSEYFGYKKIDYKYQIERGRDSIEMWI